MSHIATIQAEIRDLAAVEAACNRLQWPRPILGIHQLFTRKVGGLGVNAPNWRYPIVCDLHEGQVHYDNYGGNWGDPVHLDRFKQAYAVEKTTLEARKLGRSVFEQPMEDGSIRLTIQMEEST